MEDFLDQLFSFSVHSSINLSTMFFILIGGLHICSTYKGHTHMSGRHPYLLSHHAEKLENVFIENFPNKQPKSCFVHKWESFFFVLFIYHKTKFPTDKLFFFLWTKLFFNEKEKPSKKEDELVLLFFCSFLPFATQAKQKKRDTKVRTLAFFEVGKTLHCCVFWAKTVWNQKKTKLFLNVISNKFRLCLCYFFFLFRVSISKNFLSKHASLELKKKSFRRVWEVWVRGSRTSKPNDTGHYTF